MIDHTTRKEMTMKMKQYAKAYLDTLLVVVLMVTIAAGMAAAIVTVLLLPALVGLVIEFGPAAIIYELRNLGTGNGHVLPEIYQWITLIWAILTTMAWVTLIRMDVGSYETDD